MKYESVLSSILALVSIVAILISFWTLRELEQQRLLSVEPIITYLPFESKVLEPSYLCDSIIAHRFISSIRPKDLTIRLINAGRGPALNFRARWHYANDVFFNYLDKRKIDTSTLSLVQYQDSLNVTSLGCDSSSNGVSYSKVTSDYGVLLPSADVSHYLKVRIPREFIEVALMSIRADRITNGLSIESGEEFRIPATLELLYDSLYKKKYKFELKAIVSVAPTSFGIHSFVHEDSVGESIVRDSISISSDYIFSTELEPLDTKRI